MNMSRFAGWVGAAQPDNTYTRGAAFRALINAKNQGRHGGLPHSRQAKGINA